MFFTPLVFKALNTAAHLHDGQKRKAVDQPFITHPFGVAMILSEYTRDENVICAGLLHDVLEDVPGYGEQDMDRDFGPEITRIVREVSEKKDPNQPDNSVESWEHRKAGYLANLTTDSEAAMMVCAADKIHNLMTLHDSCRVMGLKIFDYFHAPLERELWFYHAVLEILLSRLKNPIVAQMAHALSNVETEVKKLQKDAPPAQ
jgi:(p)ppGpp synthase/HD superfamily hydrolase